MPDPEFTEEEIETLRQKLDSNELSSREREILTDAFVAAKEQARQKKAQAEAESMQVSLRDQAGQSYSPGGQAIVNIEIRIHP